MNFLDLFIINFILFSVLAVAFQKGIREPKVISTMVVLIVCLFIFITALRDFAFSADTANYISWLNRVSNKTDLASIVTINIDRTGVARDPGFSLLLWSVGQFTREPLFLLFFFSSLVSILIFKISTITIEEKRQIVLLLVLLFTSRLFIDFTTNQIRSTLVFLVCLYSFLAFYFNGNKVLLLLIPLMLFFHKKVVVLFLIVLFIAQFASLRILFIGLIFSLLAFAFPAIIVWPMSKFLGLFSAFGSFLYTPAFINKVAGTESIITVYFVILYNLPMALFLYFKRNDMAQKDLMLYKISLVCLGLFFSTYLFLAESFRLMQVSIPLLSILYIKYWSRHSAPIYVLLLMINIAVLNKNILESELGIFQSLV